MLFLTLIVLYTTSLKLNNMLKNVISISGVGHSFETVNNVLAVITTGGTCAIYKSFDERDHASIDGMYSGLGVYSESEFYLNEGLTSKVVEFNSMETKSKPFKVDAILGDRIISSEKEERNRYLISRLKSGEVEWRIQLKIGKHIFLDQDILINSQYLDDGRINAYKLLDGSEIWNFDTTTIGTWQDYDGSEKPTQVTKVLGIYEGIIYIYLNSGKILLLDSDSGEKITVLKNDKHPKFDTFGDSIELDIESGKLIQLARQDLIEVDLQTREVSMTRIEDMNSSNIENASRIAYDNTHIYFTDKNAQTLGALNRYTHKLDWIYKLPQERISKSEQPRFGKDIKLKDNIFYVLDNKNTLHIFDKEVESA